MKEAPGFKVFDFRSYKLPAFLRKPCDRSDETFTRNNISTKLRHSYPTGGHYSNAGYFYPSS